MDNQPSKQKLKGSESTDWKLVFFFIIGTFLYYVGCAPLCFAINYFSNRFIDVQFFDDIYYRYYVHTKYFPLQQLAYYLIMLPVGFTFINLVNLQNERKNPFKGHDGTFKDFKLTFVFAIMLFMFSGIVVLRQDYDLDTYCKEGNVQGSKIQVGQYDTLLTQFFTQNPEDVLLGTDEADIAQVGQDERDSEITIDNEIDAMDDGEEDAITVQFSPVNSTASGSASSSSEVAEAIST